MSRKTIILIKLIIHVVLVSVLIVGAIFAVTKYIVDHSGKYIPEEASQAKPTTVVAELAKEKPLSQEKTISGLTLKEREMMAKTLYRESNRPFSGDTEASKVVWTMLNRFDHPDFDDDMEKILVASYDFREESPVTEENMALVNDVICRWVAEKNGIEDVGRTLPKDYCFFWGDGQINHFYKYSSGGAGQSDDEKIAYNDYLETPYNDI